jgi:hypothetical protein
LNAHHLRPENPEPVTLSLRRDPATAETLRALIGPSAFDSAFDNPAVSGGAARLAAIAQYRGQDPFTVRAGSDTGQTPIRLLPLIAA